MEAEEDTTACDVLAEDGELDTLNEFVLLLFSVSGEFRFSKLSRAGLESDARVIIFIQGCLEKRKKVNGRGGAGWQGSQEEKVKLPVFVFCFCFS